MSRLRIGFNLNFQGFGDDVVLTRVDVVSSIRTVWEYTQEQMYLLSNNHGGRSPPSELEARQETKFIKGNTQFIYKILATLNTGFTDRVLFGREGDIFFEL